MTQFIGYYCLIGPQGYVEGTDRQEVVTHLYELLKKWPNARAGTVERKWFSRTWRASVRSK